jgi:hypothetical protein
MQENPHFSPSTSPGTTIIQDYSIGISIISGFSSADSLTTHFL